jgi:hypothetical protein
MTDIARIDSALMDIRAEVIRATALHGPIRSSHEGYGVIKEEFDELWDDIKANDPISARVECTQLGAMAVRYMVDVQ